MRRIGNRVHLASLLALFALLLGACGSSGGGTTTGSGTPTKPVMKVGLVTDIGGLNDMGFNHLAYTGYKKAEQQYVAQHSNPPEVENTKARKSERHEIGRDGETHRRGR